MADAIKNAAWTVDVEQAGTYTLATGGKYVDRNIEIVVPEAEESINGTVNATVPVTVGSKNGTSYPLVGTQSITGTATATVDAAGFTSEGSYEGTVTGTATVSGSIDAIEVNSSVDINTINISPSANIGDKSTNAYPFSVTTSTTTNTSVTVKKTGYAEKNDKLLDSASGTASVTIDGNLPIAGITATGSATVKPTSMTANNGTAKIASAATTTQPTAGYYVSATAATAASTDITGSCTVTDGYIKSADASSLTTVGGTVTGGNGSEYFIPIQGAEETKGKTTVSGTTATRGEYSISEGYIESDSLGVAKFTNAAVGDNTYVDISATSDAPILISDDYLYITEGYVDNVKISLARLVPDLDDYDVAGSGDIIAGKTLYDGDGKPVTGTIVVNSATDLEVDGGTVKVPAGYYATEVSKSVAEGTITNNTTGGVSSGTINAGQQIKIGKGYYADDVYYQAQEAGSAIDHEAITGSLTSSIDTGYTAPTLVDAKAADKAYVTLSGNGSMTAGNIYNGTATAQTQYMEVYTGSYTIA